MKILQTLKQQKALVEITLKQQQAQIADLAQKLASIGATQADVRMEPPRFDVDGQSICFKCR